MEDKMFGAETLDHDADVFGSNRGDFKPIGRLFVTSLTPC